MELLKQMRFKEVKNEQKLLRVIGIHPEDLMRDQVIDSFTAGETHFHDKKTPEVGAISDEGCCSDEESTIDFV